jgi:hypothetical protein
MGRINHLFYDTGKYVSSWSGENFTWGAIGQGLARSDMTWSFRNQWRIFDGMIPVTGEEAYCIAEPQELQIRQSGCELDFRASTSTTRVLAAYQTGIATSHLKTFRKKSTKSSLPPVPIRFSSAARNSKSRSRNGREVNRSVLTKRETQA